MAARTRKSERRTEALSRDRIIDAAISVLDAAGEEGLTFKALTEHLSTGPGAIYWHVAKKSELLDAATERVIAAALTVELQASSSPEEAIGVVALRLFDAIEEHPWLAAQLAGQLSRPWQSVVPRLLESIGRHVKALGVPKRAWLTSTIVLVHYILGAAGQNAVNDQNLEPGTQRGPFFESVARAWKTLDADEYPFTRAVADELDHDDRAELLAGIRMILAGIAATYPADASSAAGRSGARAAVARRR